MNAIVYRQYGSPDVLAMQDVPKPSPAIARCWYEFTPRR